MHLRAIAATMLLIGCKSGEGEHKAVPTSIANVEPAPALPKCLPNHESELPEEFACQGSLGNGFSAYEWEVKTAGDFVITVQAQAPDELIAPELKVNDADVKDIHSVKGTNSVELRARFVPGRYSLIVLTAATKARQFRFAAARVATAPANK